MAITAEKVLAFMQYAGNLTSFPLFCAYLLLVFLAPVWQRFTRPMTLTWILVVYNSLVTVLNLVTTVGLVWGLCGADHLFQKTNYEPLRPYMWLYWTSKQIELLDTVFMVLRHRGRQLTFLHVYHHASMVLLTDAGYHTWYWPAIAFPVTVNALVHVVLYLYYSLAALRPNNPPSWRKLLTQTQIVQFLVDLVFSVIGYMFHGFCIYGILYGLFMVALFSNFYHKAYIRTKSKDRKRSAANGNAQVNNGKTHRE